MVQLSPRGFRLGLFHKGGSPGVSSKRVKQWHSTYGVPIVFPKAGPPRGPRIGTPMGLLQGWSPNGGSQRGALRSVFHQMGPLSVVPMFVPKWESPRRFTQWGSPNSGLPREDPQVVSLKGVTEGVSPKWCCPSGVRHWGSSKGCPVCRRTKGVPQWGTPSLSHHGSPTGREPQVGSPKQSPKRGVPHVGQPMRVPQVGTTIGGPPRTVTHRGPRKGSLKGDPPIGFIQR